MIELSLLFPIAVFAYLLYRKDRQFDAFVARVNDQRIAERREWSIERNALLNRIQAPEVAGVQVVQEGDEPDLKTDEELEMEQMIEDHFGGEPPLTEDEREVAEILREAE